MAALILLTLRGTICLYNGEELGMTDEAPPPGSARDRAGRDAARGRFRWEQATQQAADPGSLLAWYRHLIGRRRRSPALRHGSLRLLEGLPPSVLGWERLHGPHRVRVLANMGERPAMVMLDTVGPIRLEGLTGRILGAE